MKKFFTIAFMALATLVANAQTPEEGTFSVTPKVGITYGGYIETSYVSSGKVENNGEIGFAVGAEASYVVNGWFKPSFGVMYQSVSNNFKNDGTDIGTQTIGYLSIPLLANFYVSDGFALKVGVQPSFLLSASANKGIGNQKSFYNSSDFIVPVGASYEIGNIEIDGRINLGFGNIIKDDCYLGPCAKLCNGFFTLTVGYRFDL